MVSADMGGAAGGLEFRMLEKAIRVAALATCGRQLLE